LIDWVFYVDAGVDRLRRQMPVPVSAPNYTGNPPLAGYVIISVVFGIAATMPARFSLLC
jgi:hypothetical protein